tara:strand:- start:5721 stop:6026 length:306 start_codon:yes stop_codon:yes gene_type:complete
MENFARTCSVTNEGMNEGWCWGEGAFYTKHKEDTLKECENDKEYILGGLEQEQFQFENEVENEEELIEKVKNSPDKLTSEELLSIAYGIDYLYWTTWEIGD